MKELKLKKNTLVLGILGSTSGVGVHSEVLWDQPPGASYIIETDQVFEDFPAFDIFQVHDVNFTDSVNIDTIKAWFTNNNAPIAWPASATAVLNIFDNDPLTSSNDPSTGTSVDVTFSVDGTFLMATASGLDIDLDPGKYWIGITPEISFSAFGQEYHLTSAAAIGDPSMTRNAGGAFSIGTDWLTVDDAFSSGFVDGSIVIEGSVNTGSPTGSPTKQPTSSPTKEPTGSPTKQPTSSPTKEPTGSPTKEPTGNPTKEPTNSPTKEIDPGVCGEPLGECTKDVEGIPVDGNIAYQKGKNGRCTIVCLIEEPDNFEGQPGNDNAPVSFHCGCPTASSSCMTVTNADEYEECNEPL